MTVFLRNVVSLGKFINTTLVLVDYALSKDLGSIVRNLQHDGRQHYRCRIHKMDGAAGYGGQLLSLAQQRNISAAVSLKGKVYGYHNVATGLPFVILGDHHRNLGISKQIPVDGSKQY